MIRNNFKVHVHALVNKNKAGVNSHLREMHIYDIKNLVLCTKNKVRHLMLMFKLLTTFIRGFMFMSF